MSIITRLAWNSSNNMEEVWNRMIIRIRLTNKRKKKKKMKRRKHLILGIGICINS